jgi:hypothetical protein
LILNKADTLDEAFDEACDEDEDCAERSTRDARESGACGGHGAVEQVVRVREADEARFEL